MLIFKQNLNNILKQDVNPQVQNKVLDFPQLLKFKSIKELF